MTDEQLQESIDKTMAMAMPTEGGYQHDKFRELAKTHLESLFKIQATRAALAHMPGIRPGMIQEIKT